MNARPQLLGHMLMEFNQLPSRTLHRSRWDAFASPSNLAVLEANPKARVALHRHWSSAILRGLGAASAPVCDTQKRELMLALLPTGTLDNLTRRTGAVLCGPLFRRIIVGAKVRTLRAALGDEVLMFVRQAEALHPGLESTQDWTLEAALDAVDELGRRTLLAAVGQAGPELVRRVELKMLPMAPGPAPLEVDDAWELERRIIEKMEPKWLSLFPKDR